MEKKSLVINPGGSSTKISVFEGRQEVLKENITHTAADLAPFPHVFDEYAYRKDLIVRTVEAAGHPMSSFDCVVGRGGLMRPLVGGTYAVNDRMVEDLRNAVNGEHASNLGAVIAKQLGDEIGVPSFVVDPVAVDEMIPEARITGISDIEKLSWFHALNHKAVSRKVAEGMGKRYEDCNFIVAHLGSGISIVAHEKGRMIDGSGGRTDGPFSPERSGGLPTYQLIELCYSGKYTHEEMVRKVSFVGGMYDYLGTKDMREIETLALAGDEKYAAILNAFIYQVSKEIALYGASLRGKVDRVILTGGIAHSNYVVEQVTGRVSYLAPVEVVPGEMEMEALALGALRVLEGQEPV
ncbi:MAG: butyrate kinase, partial [Oscillospiraceae bacterium]